MAALIDHTELRYKLMILNYYMQIIHSAAAAAVSTYSHLIRNDHLQGNQLDSLIGDDLPCEPMSFSA